MSHFSINKSSSNRPSAGTYHHQRSSSNNNNFYFQYNGNNGNSAESPSEMNDSKNSSVSSSVARFAFEGYQRASHNNRSYLRNNSLSPNSNNGNGNVNDGASGSGLANGDVVNHLLKKTYRSVTGRDMSQRNLEEADEFLRGQATNQTKYNEARYVEKLKLHLIHQAKHSEAKKFVELHQKLKGSQVMKGRDREAFVVLLYELFDKEATRAAMNARKQASTQSFVSSGGSDFSMASNSSKQTTTNSVGENRTTSLVVDANVDLPLHSTKRDVGRVSNRHVFQPGSLTAKKEVHSENRPVTASNRFQQGSASVMSSQSHGPGRRRYNASKALEKEVIKDLVYIFQGIDGNVIKSNSEGVYEFVSKQPVPFSLRLGTSMMCELGFFCKKIRSYCDKPIEGLFSQGLKHALENELQEFFRLLAIVQSQVQQTTVDTPMSEEVPKRGNVMSMAKLNVWMRECRPRLQAVAKLLDKCGMLKGGKICSVIYRHSLHGHPTTRAVTNSLLSTVAKPLYLMLCQWILYGELEDPFNEFFIAADPYCKKDALWHKKYTLRKEMLPSFISDCQARKILATGKNINFLKEICHNSKGYDGRNQIKSLLERSPVECMFLEEDKLLYAAIDKAYKTTSDMVLKVLIEESKLLDHLKAIKNYLLLGQGDFIQHLLELIQDELSKPAAKVFHHNTSAILETAIRATNAQFESEDILSRLDTRPITSSDKDLGWDVFCLDYKAHGPIGTVLTEIIMIRYNQLFNSLWKIKRVEMILSILWKNQTTLFKHQRAMPELGAVLHRSQLLISELIHFVHQTQYYIMFEATECAWEKLMLDVSKASDLDQVIEAHGRFLESVTTRSLLDPASRPLLNQLRGIFESVHELKSFLFGFEKHVLMEIERRNNPDVDTATKDIAVKLFFDNIIKPAKGRIETLYTTTQDLVRSFLLVLNRQPDLTLQCLSFRLDFSEYYHRRDCRLSQPLTHHHRRMSSNNFDTVRVSQTALPTHTFTHTTSIPEDF